jgi:serine/threonine protein kinase
VTENSLSWLGRTIDGCSIENQLADGAFSWIYQVREVDTQSTGNTEQSLESRWIFKVAKPEELVHQGGLDPFCTQALTITNDGTRLVTPNTNLLLSEQHAKLARRLDTGLVRVRNLNADSGRSYFKMEYLDGTNLRQFFQKELDGMSILTDLACQFAAMKNLQTFPYHGDLKPENIMVTMDGAKAIDAGYFGTLDCEGQSLEIAVTTP